MIGRVAGLRVSSENVDRHCRRTVTWTLIYVTRLTALIGADSAGRLRRRSVHESLVADQRAADRPSAHTVLTTDYSLVLFRRPLVFNPEFVHSRSLICSHSQSLSSLLRGAAVFECGALRRSWGRGSSLCRCPTYNSYMYTGVLSLQSNQPFVIYTVTLYVIGLYEAASFDRRCQIDSRRWFVGQIVHYDNNLLLPASGIIFLNHRLASSPTQCTHTSLRSCHPIL